VQECGLSICGRKLGGKRGKVRMYVLLVSSVLRQVAGACHETRLGICGWLWLQKVGVTYLIQRYNKLPPTSSDKDQHRSATSPKPNYRT
jgi:hypothetical protein